MKSIVIFLIVCLMSITLVCNVCALDMKWSKTPEQIGITGEAVPVLCDVNDDGIKEIFWAGKPWDDRENANMVVVCVDGRTGEVIWDEEYLQYWGSGNEMRHLPIMVYDFVKSNPGYEVIATGASMCRDADTGEVLS